MKPRSNPVSGMESFQPRAVLTRSRKRSIDSFRSALVLIRAFQKRLRALFKEWDKDQDGILSREESREMLKVCSILCFLLPESPSLALLGAVPFSKTQSLCYFSTPDMHDGLICFRQRASLKIQSDGYLKQLLDDKDTNLDNAITLEEWLAGESYF
eukprot:751035-Hanusia_phi.AAC.1